jgi:hypothetical protein
MPIIAFIVISSIGVLSTRALLKGMSKSGGFTHHERAFTLAIGYGITWFFSFLIPISIARGFVIEFGLFKYIIISSLIVGILSYVSSRFLFLYIEMSKNRK